MIKDYIILLGWLTITIICMITVISPQIEFKDGLKKEIQERVK